MIIRRAKRFVIRKDPSVLLSDPIPLMVSIPGEKFAISRYPVTQELWGKLMLSTPSVFRVATRPVENVSWNDCQEFLAKLNDVLGEGKQIFRLPTQKEWEFACRAGAVGGYCKLEDDSEITRDTLGEVAWYDKNSGEQTHTVGQKKPNAFGLYDMLGNVWEWTSTESGFGRASCGGSFGSLASTISSDAASVRDGSRGFRLACDIVHGD